MVPLLLPDPDHRGEDNGVRVTVTMTFRTTLLGIVPTFKRLTIVETADAVAVQVPVSALASATGRPAAVGLVSGTSGSLGRRPRWWCRPTR